MRRLRILIATSVVALLAISTSAAPVSAAAGGKMAFVNGIPGTRVDVCIGNKRELKSGLAYGKTYKRSLAGTKKLRIREAGRGTCRGKVLARRNVRFTPGSDKTIVATAKRPKVLVFDNAALGTAALPPDGAIALRHAADLGANSVYFYYSVWDEPLIRDQGFTPSAVASPFDKGDQFTSGLVVPEEDRVMRVKVTRTDPAVVIARGPLVDQVKLRRYEYIFVGTKHRNAKLVQVISRLVSPPAPTP